MMYIISIKGSVEKDSHTSTHHPVVKPPAVHSTAVSHTPTLATWLGKLLGTILESIAIYLQRICIYNGYRYIQWLLSVEILA